MPTGNKRSLSKPNLNHIGIVKDPYGFYSVLLLNISKATKGFQGIQPPIIRTQHHNIQQQKTNQLKTQLAGQD